MRTLAPRVRRDLRCSTCPVLGAGCRVAHLYRQRHLGGPRREERFKAVEEGVEAGELAAVEVGELKAAAQQLFAEQPGRGKERVHPLAAVEQRLLVRDDLGNLQAEAEARRGVVPPTLDHSRRQAAVERAVHIDDGVVLGEEGQVLAGRQPLELEDARPLLVRPAAAAGANLVSGEPPRMSRASFGSRGGQG